MKLRRILLVAFLSIAAWTFLILPSAEASCAGPTFVLSQSSGKPGGALTVTGQGVIEKCNDTGSRGGIPPLEPAKKIKIFFVQGKKKQQIAITDANSKLEVSVDVVIPQDASPGAATIVMEARDGMPRPVAFTVKSSDAK